MRPTISPSISPSIKAINPVKSGLGRYTMLLVGLGAAGVAIGWIAPERRP